MTENDKKIIAELAQSQSPSVRYFALTGLMDKPENDNDVLRAKADIMLEGAAAKILAKQEPGGYWGGPEEFYQRSKYKGTCWNLNLLAELGADGNDPRIRALCEFILAHSFDPKSGGYSFLDMYRPDRKKRASLLPCLTANMTWSLIRFGYQSGPRIVKSLEWLAKFQRFDTDGGPDLDSLPFKVYPNCWGKHTCSDSVLKMLKLFSEIPENMRTPAIEETASKGIDYLLAHCIYKSCKDPGRIAMPEWTMLGFPHFWDSDVIEGLSILIKLGVRDKRMDDAFELVRSKRSSDGWWINERSYQGRLAAPIERDGRRSEWVTLRALKVLKDHIGD